MPADPGTTSASEHSQPNCDGCALGRSRRDFMRDMIAMAALALAAMTVPGEAAAAIEWTEAESRTGDVLRYAVPATDGANIDRDHQVILVRWQATAYAFALSCPHQSTALRWNEKAARFQCPKHQSRYTPDGTFVSGRATRGMDRYAIRRVGTELEVNLTALYEQDRDRTGWEAAAVALDPGGRDG